MPTKPTGYAADAHKRASLVLAIIEKNPGSTAKVVADKYRRHREGEPLITDEKVASVINGLYKRWCVESEPVDGVDVIGRKCELKAYTATGRPTLSRAYRKGERPPKPDPKPAKQDGPDLTVYGYTVGRVPTLHQLSLMHVFYLSSQPMGHAQ